MLWDNIRWSNIPSTRRRNTLVCCHELLATNPTPPPLPHPPTQPPHPHQPTQPPLPHPPTPPTLPHPPTPTVPSPERLLQWFLRCVFFFSKVSLACKYSHLVSQPLLEVSNERRLCLQSRVFRLEMLIFSPFAHHQGLRFFLLL